MFHLFLNGEVKGRRKLEISINGNPVESFDPFCRQYDATQTLNTEFVRIEGEEIRIQPYILPHHSKLTLEQLDFYKKRSDFVANVVAGFSAAFGIRDFIKSCENIDKCREQIPELFNFKPSYR